MLIRMFPLALKAGLGLCLLSHIVEADESTTAVDLAKPEARQALSKLAASKLLWKKRFGEKFFKVEQSVRIHDLSGKDIPGNPNVFFVDLKRRSFAARIELLGTGAARADQYRGIFEQKNGKWIARITKRKLLFHRRYLKPKAQ